MKPESRYCMKQNEKQKRIRSCGCSVQGKIWTATIVLYKYAETRARFNAAEFLNGFQGYLETDCYHRNRHVGSGTFKAGSVE